MEVEKILLILLVFSIVLTNIIMHFGIEYKDNTNMAITHIINICSLTGYTYLIYTCTNIPKYYKK
jgi:hypothetical protein